MQVERDFFIENLMVRIHLIIEMILVDRPCAMGVRIAYASGVKGSGCRVAGTTKPHGWTSLRFPPFPTSHLRHQDWDLLSHRNSNSNLCQGKSDIAQ